MKTTTVSGLFLVAALYDGLLGLAFLVAADWIFQCRPGDSAESLGVRPVSRRALDGLRDHVRGHRPAAPGESELDTLRHSAEGFLLRRRGLSLARRRNPHLWKPFVVIDLVFLVLFLLAYRSLGQGEGLRQF